MTNSWWTFQEHRPFWTIFYQWDVIKPLIDMFQHMYLWSFCSQRFFLACSIDQTHLHCLTHASHFHKWLLGYIGIRIRKLFGWEVKTHRMRFRNSNRLCNLPLKHLGTCMYSFANFHNDGNQQCIYQHLSQFYPFLCYILWW